MKPIVGEGLAPPETSVKMTLICEANQSFRRDVPQPETALLCRFATPPLRGDHIGRPHGRGIIFLSNVFENRIVRHSADGQLRSCPNLLRCCQNLDFGYSTHALADLANNSHATALHRRRALYSVGISGWYALTSHCGSSSPHNSGSYGDPVFAIG